jgi:hypothetical protein
VFVIASLIGDFHVPQSAQDVGLMLLGLGAGVMFVAPFFVLAWTVRRWPRITGYCLLAVAALLFLVLFRTPELPLSTQVMTRAMLVGPLLATGTAVLLEVRNQDRSAGPDS